MATKKNSPTWSDVKSSLATLDRAGLLSIVQDLYGASKENQAFLHTRFACGEDVLKPYKTSIERWIAPDVYKNQDVSVAKAKKAIADYKKARGSPADTAELMVFYCECAADFSQEFGNDDESYFDALVRMFEQALKILPTLSAPEQKVFLARLDAVCDTCRDFGYGVGDDMDMMLGDSGLRD